MKGLILAGGRGTRMTPLTRTLAKQLVPVANRPILHYVVDQITAAGIHEIGVIISPKTGSQIRQALNGRPDATFTFLIQREPLGLAHAVRTAREHLGEEAFLMVLGDNLLGGGLNGFVDHFERMRPDALILLKEVKDPRRFGVAELDPWGRLVRVVEKPERPVSNLALVGAYVFSPRIHEAIEALAPSKRGELEITDALQALIAGGRDVRHAVLGAWWVDAGRPDQLLEANRRILEDTVSRQVRGRVGPESRVLGNVRLGAGSRVEGSTVIGPAVIGPHSVIVASTIGPYASVGAGCHIARAGVADSVVLDNARIEGIAVRASLIASNAEVAGLGPEEPAPQMVVEEGGRVRLS